MRKWLRAAVGLGTCVLAWQLAGCTGSPLQTSVDFNLGESLGEFEVTADEPKDNSGTSQFDTPVTIGRGSLELKPSAITVTPSGAPKEVGTIQAESTLVVTVWIAPADEIDTVCGGGEEYGPFNVTLDDNNVPTAVEPSRVTFTQETIGLLNGGEFSLCVRVVSPIDGTVTIESLVFNLGL